MDYFHFRMGKTADFPVSEKYVRLVLLGASDFTFVPVLLFILEQKLKRNLWLTLLIIFYSIPMLAFQTVHAIATGNGEWNYRRTIGLF